MCGITGFVSKEIDYDYIHNINNIIEPLKRRGPNNFSHEIYDNLAFGHTRLSIIDLSTKANQPMYSFNKKFLITYNGEIYNFKYLKKLLNIETYSDTRILLECISRYGLDKTLKIVSGMFAIALFDIENKKLYLARDIAGEKPLYYGYLENKNHFIFASQISSIIKHEKWINNINQETLNDFLNFGFIPSNKSIFDNIFKLEPGHYLSINTDTLDNFSLKKWSNSNIKLPKDSTNNKSFIDYQGELENELENTIINNSVSDVPIGAHLSGGIDSSLICAIAKKKNIDFTSYTIAFDEKDFDESLYAKNIANYLKIKNKSFLINENEILRTINHLSSIYDEPFADSSQIPSTILSKYASKDVKVMLTGDGADELFCGYNRHIYLNEFMSNNFFKNKLYTSLISIIDYLSENIFFKKMINKILSNKLSNPLEQILKIKRIINSKDIVQGYFSIIGVNDIRLNNNDKIRYNNFIKNINNEIDKILSLDFNIYLPNDILIKSDRSSMYYGLENRSPYLSKSIIDFSNNLPLKYKINKKISKYILRSVLYKNVPSKFFNRPKHGFSIPIYKFLNNNLREWVLNLLNENSIDSIKDYKIELMNEFKNKSEFDDYNSFKVRRLWNLLMFEAWYINYLK